MRIAIIGTGHMGGWLAQTLAARGHEVAVYDVDAKKTAPLAGTCEVLSGLDKLVAFRPELAINAVSLPKTVEVFGPIVKNTDGSCALADVASVKGGLAQFYAGCARAFVSMHPMFGPTFAHMGRLDEENVIIASESDGALAAFFTELFEAAGLTVHRMPLAEHDRMMAYSLTLPFASSLVFAGCMEPETVPGTTFRKHMAIAKGLMGEDDWLLCEILFNAHSLKELEKVTARLEFLKHIVKARDHAEAGRFFSKIRKNLADGL